MYGFQFLDHSKRARYMQYIILAILLRY